MASQSHLDIEHEVQNIGNVSYLGHSRNPRDGTRLTYSVYIEQSYILLNFALTARRNETHARDLRL